MKLRYVTLTGADNKTSIQKMVDLNQKYAFAEFAILFSQSKSNEPRYPSWDWVQSLSDVNLRLSAHLCGKWVDDAINYGRITLFDGLESVGKKFSRVQFNLANGRLSKVLSDQDCKLWNIETDFDVIFGGPYKILDSFDPEVFYSKGIAPLFDASGGRGIIAEKWPNIPYCKNGSLWCGYAGGLGLDNLSEELKRIEEAVGDSEIWIDMETKLRNKKDEFDLEICEKILEITSNWT